MALNFVGVLSLSPRGAPDGPFTLQRPSNMSPGFASGDVPGHDVGYTKGVPEGGVCLAGSSSLAQFDNSIFREFGRWVFLALACASQYFYRVAYVFARCHPFEVTRSIIEDVAVFVVCLVPERWGPNERGEHDAGDEVGATVGTVFVESDTQVSVSPWSLFEDCSGSDVLPSYIDANRSGRGHAVDSFESRDREPSGHANTPCCELLVNVKSTTPGSCSPWL